MNIQEDSWVLRDHISSQKIMGLTILLESAGFQIINSYNSHFPNLGHTIRKRVWFTEGLRAWNSSSEIPYETLIKELEILIQNNKNSQL